MNSGDSGKSHSPLDQQTGKTNSRPPASGLSAPRRFLNSLHLSQESDTETERPPPPHTRPSHLEANTTTDEVKRESVLALCDPHPLPGTPPPHTHTPLPSTPPLPDPPPSSILSSSCWFVPELRRASLLANLLSVQNPVNAHDHSRKWSRMFPETV